MPGANKSTPLLAVTLVFAALFTVIAVGFGMPDGICCHRWYHINVNKTTVYLPDDLKQALTRIAAASGRSEADLIREAITTMARAWERPRPRGGLFASGDPSLAEHAEEALAGFGDR